MTLQECMDEVRRFHDKHGFHQNIGSQLTYRLCLMMEELGEISSCITKGATSEQIAEEHADLFILLLGNCIVANIDLESEFQSKMHKIMQREAIETPLGPRVTETKRNL